MVWGQFSEKFWNMTLLVEQTNFERWILLSSTPSFEPIITYLGQDFGSDGPGLVPLYVQ